jgi:hypothetical protein
MILKHMLLIGEHPACCLVVQVAHNWRVETRYVVVVIPDPPPGSRSPEDKDDQLVLRAANSQRTILVGTSSQVVQFLKILDFK